MTRTHTITQPDDWHCHLREGAALARTVPDTAKQFARCIVMPNLATPVTTVTQALAYREAILAHVPPGLALDPLMVLYLTPETTEAEVRAAQAAEHIHAYKLYPAGATTHSAHGVSDIERLYPIFAVMEAVDLPLLIHGESIDPHIDVFDREAVFVERQLTAIRRQFPALRIVLEHISTQIAVDFVLDQPAAIQGATITPQHVLYHRNQLFAGGLQPHYYCLPLLKHQKDQQALRQAACSGNPRFFLGTDSAPHAEHQKLKACGCAGIYSAHAAIELYASVFDAEGALDQLNGFAAEHGPRFYGLPVNTDTLTLVAAPWVVPETLALGDDPLVPLCAGEALSWQIKTP